MRTYSTALAFTGRSAACAAPPIARQAAAPRRNCFDIFILCGPDTRFAASLHEDDSRECGANDTTGKTLARAFRNRTMSSTSHKNILLFEIRKTCHGCAVPPRHEGRDGHSSPDVRRD